MSWKESEQQITSLIRSITESGETSGHAANQLTKQFYSSAARIARRLVKKWERNNDKADDLSKDIASWVLVQVLRKIADGTTINKDREGLWNYIRKAIFRHAERRKILKQDDRQHQISTVANFSTFVGTNEPPEAKIYVPDDLFNSYLRIVMEKFGPDKLITKAVMLELEGLDQNAIAEKLGTTQANVSRKLHFAKLQLMSSATEQ